MSITASLHLPFFVCHWFCLDVLNCLLYMHHTSWRWLFPHTEVLLINHLISIMCSSSGAQTAVAVVWSHVIYLVRVTWASACGTAAFKVLLTHSWSRTTETDRRAIILTHPLAFLALQLAEEKLQLFYCDAVAGEHTQHVDQQICKAGTHKKQRLNTDTYWGGGVPGPECSCVPL